MTHHPAAQSRATNDALSRAAEAPNTHPRENAADISAPQSNAPDGAKRSDSAAPPNVSTLASGRQRTSQIKSRGLTSEIHPTLLQEVMWLRALSMLNRFRVIRAVDVALACCPERPFKAALTAAQRAMRGMAKTGLVRRYRTDRFQHVYGLTTAGARWLQDRGAEGSPSVRRVADMSNPEHRLWMSFIVLACEARGLRALTESEVLQELNRPIGKKRKPKQGLTTVEHSSGKHVLRPDAIAFENDGATWFEIDRSKRGADREESLSLLVGRIGLVLEKSETLRRVVVLARTDRILLRAQAVLRAKALTANSEVLVPGRGRHFRNRTRHMGSVGGSLAIRRWGRNRCMRRTCGDSALANMVAQSAIGRIQQTTVVGLA